MKDSELVWSSEHGDMRKKGKQSANETVDESKISLELRRLTSGKGRAVIEIKGLPNNKKWNQKLCKDIKKKLGAGGAHKNDFIEIHVGEIEKVTNILDQKQLQWKKVGG